MKSLEEELHDKLRENRRKGTNTTVNECTMNKLKCLIRKAGTLGLDWKEVFMTSSLLKEFEEQVMLGYVTSMNNTINEILRNRNIDLSIEVDISETESYMRIVYNKHDGSSSVYETESDPGECGTTVLKLKTSKGKCEVRFHNIKGDIRLGVRDELVINAYIPLKSEISNCVTIYLASRGIKETSNYDEIYSKLYSNVNEIMDKGDIRAKNKFFKLRLTDKLQLISESITNPESSAIIVELRRDDILAIANL